MTTVRVIIADDHEVVRAGLVGLLGTANGIEVVGEAVNGVQAVAMAGELHPDLVLTDLRMPELDGVGVSEALRGRVPVLILTTYRTDRDIVRAIESGAAGYVLKDAPRDELVSAVRAAARGQTVLAPALASRLAEGLRSAHAEPSPRELEVLSLIAEGSSNAEIARRLHISETTVKTHLMRTFDKLGASDRAHAVVLAIRNGYLEP